MQGSNYSQEDTYNSRPPMASSTRRLPRRQGSADGSIKLTSIRRTSSCDLPENMYPDMAITSQQYKNAKAMANSHRRQRHMRFQVNNMKRSEENGEEPEITNPMGESFSSLDYRSINSFSKNTATTTATCMDDSSFSIERVIRDLPQRNANRSTGNASCSRSGDLSRSCDLSCGPEITTPMGDSFVNNTDEDSQREFSDSVPRNVDLSGSFKSKDIYVDDDDLLSQSQYVDYNFKLEEESACDSVSRVPNPRDKTSIRRLAAQHRSSLCGGNRSTAESVARRIQEELLREAETSCSRASPPPPPPASRGSSPRSNSNHSNSDRTMIEIYPGFKAPLRGSEDALRAVACRFYVGLTCFGCSTNLYCVADAQYTMCPLCRVVSPLEGEDDRMERWGLGLGFTEKSLWDMEDQLAAEERCVRY